MENLFYLLFEMIHTSFQFNVLAYAYTGLLLRSDKINFSTINTTADTIYNN